MIDYQTQARRRQIRRYVLALKVLQAVYVVAVGLCVGAVVSAILIVLTRR